MILTVTLNPLLENRLYFESVSIKGNNRANKQAYKSGGKGINISRQLNLFGLKNMAFTFLGGNNGKKLRQILNEEKINHSPVSCKNDTRAASIIIDEKSKSLTTYFEPDSEISEKEVNEFKDKLKKAMNNCSVVVFAGSSPCEATDSIFPYGIEIANKLDKFSILDTYGRHLDECVKQSPTAVHNNIAETEKSLGKSLKSEQDIIEHLKYLYDNKVKLSFITNGDKPTYASKYDFIYKIMSPSVKCIDPTGSGDAFVSGIIYGLEKALVFDDFIRYASALGALNASRWEVCTVNPREAEELKTKVEVEPIGKKMKIIDDSPNYQ